MEGEFWAVELLMTVNQLPNLEFILVESRCDHEALVWVLLTTFSPDQVARVSELNDGADSLGAVGVSVHVFDDLLLVNAPDLHLASLSAYHDEIFINLEESSG